MDDQTKSGDTALDAEEMDQVSGGAFDAFLKPGTEMAGGQPCLAGRSVAATPTESIA